MKQIGDVLGGLQKDESPQSFTSEDRSAILELVRKAAPYLPDDAARAALESATSDDVTVLVVAAA
jgi:hypothetical protein